MLFNDDRLLFFDDTNIESRENVSLKMNPPVKAGPCLTMEKDWEIGRTRADSIVYWNGEYRLYCDLRIEGRRLLSFYTSKDGVNWERPELGVVERNGSTANNLVDIGDGDPGEFCVFVDPSGPDEHRFKAITHHQSMGGMYMLTSPDGLRFKRADGHLLQMIADNHMTAFFDERIGKYVIYTRGWDRSRAIADVPGSRCVVRAETDDLFRPLSIDKDAPEPWPVAPKWSDIVDGGLRRINQELPKVIFCDEQDPPQGAFYQAAAVHYLKDVYFAFPTLYYSWPGPPAGFINDGILDLQFAASHDGIEWQRDHRGSYVRLDTTDGYCSQAMHMLVGMVPNGHTLSQYYVGGRYSHGYGRVKRDEFIYEKRKAQLGDPMAHRVEQRLDGFVSADSAYTGGEMTTRPFVIENDTLKLNIDTSASGVAHAALLDESGKAIEGFELENCDRIQGNDTHLVISWKASSDVSALKGKKVKLMLKSRHAKLFAIYP